MKRILVIALLAAAFPSFLLAFGEKQTGKSAGAKEEIKNVMTQVREAQQAGDSATLARHLADDYTFTNPFGEVMTKTETVSDLKTGKLKFETMKMEDMQLRVYGDTAVATSRVSLKGHRGEQDISGQYRGTWVLVKNNGQWRLVSGQSTRVAEPAMAGTKKPGADKAKTAED